MIRIICEAVVTSEATMKSLRAELRKTHARYSIYDLSIMAELTADDITKIDEVREIFEKLDNFNMRIVK